MENRVALAALGFAVMVALAVAMSAAFALPVMWLWNGVTPNLFASGVKQIDFWNAWGLALLCSLLFKTYSGTSDKK